MLFLEEPFQLLLSPNILSGGICGEVTRPAMTMLLPQSLHGQMNEVCLWVLCSSAADNSEPFDFLLLNRILFCWGWWSAEECNLPLKFVTTHLGFVPALCYSCGGLSASALQWRVCILAAFSAHPGFPRQGEGTPAWILPTAG